MFVISNGYHPCTDLDSEKLGRSAAVDDWLLDELQAWWPPLEAFEAASLPPQHTALSPSNAHCAAFRQCVTMYYLCSLLLVIEPWIGNSLKQKKFRTDWMGSLGWTPRDITPDKCQKGEKAFWEWSAVILFQKLHPSPFQLVRGNKMKYKIDLYIGRFAPNLKKQGSNLQIF